MQPILPDGELKDTSFSAAAVPAAARSTAAKRAVMQAKRTVLEPPVALFGEEETVAVAAVAAGDARGPAGAREAADPLGRSVREHLALVEHGVAGAEEVALALGAHLE